MNQKRNAAFLITAFGLSKIVTVQLGNNNGSKVAVDIQASIYNSYPLG